MQTCKPKHVQATTDQSDACGPHTLFLPGMNWPAKKHRTRTPRFQGFHCTCAVGSRLEPSQACGCRGHISTYQGASSRTHRSM